MVKRVPRKTPSALRRIWQLRNEVRRWNPTNRIAARGFNGVSTSGITSLNYTRGGEGRSTEHSRGGGSEGRRQGRWRKGAASPPAAAIVSLRAPRGEETRGLRERAARCWCLGPASQLRDAFHVKYVPCKKNSRASQSWDIAACYYKAIFTTESCITSRRCPVSQFYVFLSFCVDRVSASFFFALTEKRRNNWFYFILFFACGMNAGVGCARFSLSRKQTEFTKQWHFVLDKNDYKAQAHLSNRGSTRNRSNTKNVLYIRPTACATRTLCWRLAG